MEEYIKKYCKNTDIEPNEEKQGLMVEAPKPSSEFPIKASDICSTFKSKINYTKSQLQEINEGLSKIESIVIMRKIINNAVHGQTFLNHAMVNILLNKNLKTHPQRIDLVYMIENSIDYLSAKQALELLKEDYIISNPNMLEIVKIVSQTNYPQSLILCEIARILSQENDEKMIEIMEIISTIQDYECVKKAAIVSTDYSFSADDRLKIITEIAKGDIYTSALITTLATEYNEPLNGDLLETAEVVNSYNCRSKLISAITRMLGEEGLLSNEETKEVSIATLKYFKDYPDNETEMFSCIELFNEQTDPTYQRTFDFMIDKLLQMSHEEREEVYDFIRGNQSQEKQKSIFTYGMKEKQLNKRR
ncbi:MAG: hypothetical protein HFH47_01865 [Bacilli bacterium]|nr:hypothetical protein [Bacilli bacterium]